MAYGLWQCIGLPIHHAHFFTRYIAAIGIQFHFIFCRNGGGTFLHPVIFPCNLQGVALLFRYFVIDTSKAITAVFVIQLGICIPIGRDGNFGFSCLYFFFGFFTHFTKTGVIANLYNLVINEGNFNILVHKFF